jgi:hypothetical protein
MELICRLTMSDCYLLIDLILAAAGSCWMELEAYRYVSECEDGGPLAVAPSEWRPMHLEIRRALRMGRVLSSIQLVSGGATSQPGLMEHHISLFYVMAWSRQPSLIALAQAENLFRYFGSDVSICLLNTNKVPCALPDQRLLLRARVY